MIVLKLAQALIEELSQGTDYRRVPAGHCLDRTNRISDQRGTGGTPGTHPPRQDDELAAAELSAQVPMVPSRSACEIIELSAMIAANEACSPLEANKRALAYSGFGSFAELARRERDHVRAAIDRLPAPCSGIGMRLRDCTLAFVHSRNLETALSMGWTTDELFALRVADEAESMGPIPAWALFHWPASLVSITDCEIGFRKSSGRTILIQRFRTELECSRAWWESDEVILWRAFEWPNAQRDCPSLFNEGKKVSQTRYAVPTQTL